ncbi:MAG: 3-phosphoshikimate 1-carboxyvinyltransferase [Burkholderiaceae bacterium]|jgi:3-phosphoshikimate 1-carboxyvinyltransferase|nr:3-phosphoshikimate 1-carboxyvinyltransferase [Burkholderiaceae bacterium]MDP4968771.1 3-phosphoshikimate 1-carboxyvinyltransferase [Burkholderiaceae bacterium]MDP5112035.1 3-phosphoshikimate 1-carboxyvinyltransferase [Burkholderiaceae bacterium]
MSRADFLDLPPANAAQGMVTLPGSKSISNRVLLLSALAQGTTRIDGLLESDDTAVMLAALKQLGVEVHAHSSDSVSVTGVSRFPVMQAALFMGNAGTAIRPLTAALAVMGGHYTLSGVPRMHERPIGDLVQGLCEMGARINYMDQQGYPPIEILVPEQLNDLVRVQGSVSSQFLTAVLMAAPLAVARSGRTLTVEVIGELISKPYIEITLNLMARFGVKVERQGWQQFVIHADAVYKSPNRIIVEGDASSASYFLALGAIGGGPVKVIGVGAQSIQGDIAFAEVIEAMGAQVRREESSIEVTGINVAAGQKLKAFDTDFNLIPDAAMTAAALALFADGPCTLRNIASWRVKETDRIHAMETELRKLGAHVDSGPDWLRVYPVELGQWQDAVIDTYDDHRVAMCFSLAAFGQSRVRILDPGCVSKTFPTYFDVLSGLLR